MAAAHLKAPHANPLPRSDWWCDGKAGFASAVTAAEVANRSRAKGPRQIYRCTSCGLFHLGSAKDRTAAASKAALATLIRSR